MTGPLVFLLEDHADCSEMYARALTSAGFQVVTSQSVSDALARLCATPPRIVVTDLRLPDGSGLELVRHVKECERTTGTGVIAVTACARAADVSEALLSGCDVVLTKPCLPGTLVSEVARLLDDSPT